MARGSAEAAGPETGSERGGWAGKVVFQAPVGEGRQERPLRSLHGLWVRERRRAAWHVARCQCGFRD